MRFGNPARERNAPDLDRRTPTSETTTNNPHTDRYRTHRSNDANNTGRTKPSVDLVFFFFRPAHRSLPVKARRDQRCDSCRLFAQGLYVRARRSCAISNVSSSSSVPGKTRLLLPPPMRYACPVDSGTEGSSNEPSRRRRPVCVFSEAPPERKEGKKAVWGEDGPAYLPRKSTDGVGRDTSAGRWR
mmetsp:Transcript_1518/g.3843  ORF Transcript_1518/g.3843 Transcript_1518/m.3843 type:complete len:186 (+) Transcript_1518:83-640(+)